MDDKLTIEVKNVSKKFCKNLKYTLYYGLADISKSILGMEVESGRLREQEFWALNNISFNIRNLGIEKSIKESLDHKPKSGTRNHSGQFSNIGG